ncbi:MAG: hypothetical protein U0793_07505 [Gemmataceae bacterium]
MATDAPDRLLAMDMLVRVQVRQFVAEKVAKRVELALDLGSSGVSEQRPR